MFAPQTKPEIVTKTVQRVTSAPCPSIALIIVENISNNEEMIVTNHFIAFLPGLTSAISIELR